VQTFVRIAAVDPVGNRLAIFRSFATAVSGHAQHQRLLAVDKKHVRITDLQGLTRAFEMCVQYVAGPGRTSAAHLPLSDETTKPGCWVFA